MDNKFFITSFYLGWHVKMTFLAPDPPARCWSIMSCLDFADGWWWWGKGKCKDWRWLRESYDEGSVSYDHNNTALSLLHTFRVSSLVCSSENREISRMGNCRSKKRRNDVNMAGDGLNQASSNINRRRLRLGGGGGYGDIGNLDYANFMSGQGYPILL